MIGQGADGVRDTPCVAVAVAVPTMAGVRRVGGPYARRMRDAIRGAAYGHARREQARARRSRRGRGRAFESGSGGCHRVCWCLPGSSILRLRRDVYATELRASIRRECLLSLVDEERACAIRRDDAKTTEAVGDEPDETARGEHAGRRGRHVRLEFL